MNKAELIAQVAKTAEMTQEQAGKAIDAVMGTIQGALVAGDQVTLIGFGSFSVAERAARTGRNPQTGAPLQIAASRVPQFKAGLALKTAVSGKSAVVAPKPVVAAKAPVAVKSKKDEKKKK